MSTNIPPFHLAIPVNNLQKSIHFYGEILGCPEGRKCQGKWIDYNFYGHQLVCHYTCPQFKPQQYCNHVDKYDVPVPHFGLALGVNEWKQLRDRLLAKDIKFIVQPHIRFQGQQGQQYTMFFKDPTGNNLQIKAMTNPKNLFAKYTVVQDK